MNCLKFLRLSLVVGLFGHALLAGTGMSAELAPRNFAVELTATLSSNPPEITLHWLGDQSARTYRIYRKHLHEKTWNQIGTAGDSDVSFVDRQINVGQGYEYKVEKEGSLAFMGYGYIYAGMNLPLADSRGRVILAIEKRADDALGPELARFEYDLIGDGWTVVRMVVNSADQPAEIKERIKDLYQANPSETVALLLFGAAPVPYSGDITPDEHDNHRGAWPADVFYGDLDGSWTDNFVNSKGAERPKNHNVPGDRKFDQSELPSSMELQVGRVDLSALTCFQNKSPSRGEIDLLRQYLNKNHRFRHVHFRAEQQALLFDALGVREPEAMSAMAWRNFSPFVGRNITEALDNQYFPAASTNSFMWSAVCAGGGYNHADRVGTSDGFALHSVNVVFTTFVGSYYGDWDNESNFLRAALGANGAVLASTYSGKPQWLFHPMALGETIGYSAKITQENALTEAYLPFQPGNGQVHIALMGDPTLRAHPVEPVTRLRGGIASGGYRLEWAAATASQLQGYRVFRATTKDAPFLRLAQLAPEQTSLLVPDYRNGEVFMVRAVALTESPSGTYMNASQGVFYPDPLSGYAAEPPPAPTSLVIKKISPGAVTLAWLSLSANETGFMVQRKKVGEAAFVEIAQLPADTESFTDTGFSGGGSYAYRVAAINHVAVSAYSNEAVVSTLSAHVLFAREDRATAGQWIGMYGAEGHAIPGHEQSLPAYVSLTVSNAFLARATLTDDPRGLQLSATEWRSGNCWVAGTPFAFDLKFTDERPHQLAIYMASWSRKGLRPRVEIFDAVSGELLDQRQVSDLGEGVYLIYSISRQVHVKIIPPTWQDLTEVYGLFIDPVTMQPVRIEPAGGDFNGTVQVKMRTLTAGADIRYTTNGTVPTASSSRYQDGEEGIRLLGDAEIRARAFAESAMGPVSEASFTNKVENSVNFLRWDDQIAGNWAGRIGNTGFWIPTGGKSLPPSVQLTMSGASDWIWNEMAEDARAPFSDRSATRRRAAAWFTGRAMNFDLTIMDAGAHTVAFYFLDWDRVGREQLVEVRNADGAVVQSELLRNFQDGRYFVIRASGSLSVKVTLKQGGNAVVSGVFFDAEPAPIGPPAPLTFSAPRLDSGYYFMTVYGVAGSRFCLDRSTDLRGWICTETNALQGSAHMLFPQIGEEKARFFKAHAVP